MSIVTIIILSLAFGIVANNSHEKGKKEGQKTAIVKTVDKNQPSYQDYLKSEQYKQFKEAQKRETASKEKK